MPIQIGDKKISKLHLGSTPIKAAYLGDKKIRPSLDIAKVVSEKGFVLMDGSETSIPDIVEGGRSAVYRGAIFDPTNNNNTIISYISTPSSCDSGGARVLTYSPEKILLNRKDYTRSSGNCFPDYHVYTHNGGGILGYNGGVGQYFAGIAFIDTNVNEHSMPYFSNGSSSYDRSDVYVLGFHGNYIYYVITDNTTRNGEIVYGFYRFDVINKTAVKYVEKKREDWDITYTNTKVHFYDDDHIRVITKTSRFSDYKGTHILDIHIPSGTYNFYRDDTIQPLTSGYYGSKDSTNIKANFERIIDGPNKDRLLRDGSVVGNKMFWKTSWDNANKKMALYPVTYL